MKRPQRVRLEIRERSAYLSGPVGAIIVAAQKTGTPWMRPPATKDVISVPVDRAWDIVAYLEHAQGRSIDIGQAMLG